MSNEKWLPIKTGTRVSWEDAGGTVHFGIAASGVVQPSNRKFPVMKVTISVDPHDVMPCPHAPPLLLSSVQEIG